MRLVPEATPCGRLRQELFEYAHVLLFATAIMYVKEIALVARVVEKIKDEFDAQDKLTEEAILAAEKALWLEGSAPRASIADLGTVFGRPCSRYRGQR